MTKMCEFLVAGGDSRVAGRTVHLLRDHKRTASATRQFVPVGSGRTVSGGVPLDRTNQFSSRKQLTCLVQSAHLTVYGPMQRFCFALCLAIMVVAGIPRMAASQSGSSPVAGLTRLYEGGRVPKEREPAVVEMICRRGNAEDLQVVFKRLTEGMVTDPSLQRQVLGWLEEAATTRRMQPSRDLDRLIVFLHHNDPTVQLAALRLAAAWKLAAAEPILRQWIESQDTAVNLRKEAMEALVKIVGDQSRNLLSSTAAGAANPQVRMAAAASLAKVDLAEAARWAAQLLEEVDAQFDPSDLLAAFLDRQAGAECLANALHGKLIKPDVAKRLLRAMFASGRNDKPLADVLSDLAGLAADKPPPSPEEVAEICRDVLQQGDAARGEQVFRREDVNCLKCHSLNRAGGQVGPDLSAVGGSSPLDYIANSILNPNLAVKEQYVTRLFQTSDGRLLTGIVIDRDETQVRIRNAQGQILVIPTSDIEQELEGPSLMPVGLTKFLTYQETLDLIRFVSELGKPGPYAPPTRSFAYRYLILVNPPSELMDDIPHLEQMRQHVFQATTQAWKSHYARFDGFLPLHEISPTQAVKAVIVKAEFVVHQAGDLQLNVEFGGRWQGWIDQQPWVDPHNNHMSIDNGKHEIVLWLQMGHDSDGSLRIELNRAPDSKAQFEWVGGT